MKSSTHKGFTLIELLVVIAIIGLLSSVVLASLNSARMKARDSQKVSELVQVRTALEAYYADNGHYPIHTGWSSGTTVCNATYGSGNTYTGATGYIPGLAPTYISVLPEVPNLAGSKCFLYITTASGNDYKLMAWGAMEQYNASSPLVDPGNGGATIPCTNSGRANSYAVYSSGGVCF